MMTAAEAPTESETMKRSTSVGTLCAAAAVGICLGVAGFLTAPFEPGNEAAASTGPKSPSPSTPAASPDPPFTRNALLQTAEFLRFGWGKAEQTAVYDGVPEGLKLLCLPGASTAEGAREDYTSTYRGLQTEATEVVVRFADTAGADRTFERLSRRVPDCERADGALRATAGTRHEPRLPGVDRAVWWNTEANRTGSNEHPGMRGVIGLARVDDRLVALSLTSTSSDPAGTVQWEPLLSQAARRLV